MQRSNLLTVCLVAGFLGCAPKQVAAPPPPPTVPAVVPKPQSAVPYAFKDCRLGMTLKEFTALGHKIFYAKNGKYTSSKITIDSIGGVKCEPYFEFDDYGDGLILNFIDIKTAKDEFSNVMTAMTSKFGQATKKENQKKKTAIGAVFEGIKYTWENGVSSIEAEEIGQKIDQSEICFFYIDPAGRKEKGAVEGAKKAASDI